MFIIVSGISGAGKSTLIKSAMQTDKELFIPKAALTREQRPDDNLDEYVYLDRATFEKYIAKNKMLEYQEYRGNYYGILEQSYDNIIYNSGIAIRDIGYQGIISIKNKVNNAPNILILTDYDLIYERMIKRGDEINLINSRMESLEQELQQLKQVADFTVENNQDIEQSSSEFRGIIHSLKRGIKWKLLIQILCTIQIKYQFMY